ncbi:MAG: DMT family transporter [Chloroflexi bacterium]|nr:DMT family transporter [Chloroflexota bacterium]
MPPRLVLALGVLAVSSAAVLIRLAAEAPALAIGAYRLSIASLIVLPVAYGVARTDLRRYSPGLLGLAAASGGFLALHFAFWISSLEHTSVASSVLLVTTTPLMVAPLGAWLLKDRVTWPMLAGTVIALAGTAIIAAGDAGLPAGQAGLAPGTLLGNGLALLGAAAMAGHRLTGRRLRREVSLMAFIAVSYPVAALALVAGAVLAGQPLSGFSSETYGLLLLLGLLPQVLGHSALNWALGHMSAMAVSTAVMAEPVGASLLAFALLGEALHPSQLVGGAIVLAGVYLVLRAEATERISPAGGAILKG